MGAIIIFKTRTDAHILHLKYCIALKLRHTTRFLISLKQTQIYKNYQKTLSIPKVKKIKIFFYAALPKRHVTNDRPNRIK